MMPTKGSWRLRSLSLLPMLLAPAAQGLSLDVSSTASIEAAASYAAWGMMTWYAGNETGNIPGKLQGTWWEGGAMFMALIEYWHFTGDTTYNEETMVGMQWQAGDDDYMPSNYSNYLGNDDQMFWGLAAMTAAELQFQDTGKYSWLSLAQGVFNTQVARWETSTCGGGLRWQIWQWESGYTMKNSVSNGGLFQLAARLARYTGNTTYADWAEKIWEWSTAVDLVNSETWAVGDSVSMDNNCSVVDTTEWSYNYGIYMGGAAYMYNYTNGSSTWETAVNGLMTQIFDTFAPSTYNYTLTEISCELAEVCDRNDILFKGLTAGWLAFTALIVPSTYATILPKLQTSAQGAAASCSGAGNDTCGVRWYTGAWDHEIGLEEQMSALNVFWSILINKDNATSYAPVTSSTGGNSTSVPDAGNSDTTGTTNKASVITTGDKAGAGILTTLIALGVIGSVYWIVTGT